MLNDLYFKHVCLFQLGETSNTNYYIGEVFGALEVGKNQFNNCCNSTLSCEDVLLAL